MNGGGVLGGGVIFVVAALLWVAVLVPSWMRRREFRAAERNALRLQRTLRVLAETAEVPQEVRLEATAKQALAQEKLLRSAQKRQEAEREAELAEARAEQVRAEIRAQQMKRKQAAAQRAAKLRRPVVRRMRALAALAALVSLVGLVLGIGMALAGSGAAILVSSGAILATALGALVLIAPGRTRVQRIAAEEVEPSVAVAPAVEEPEEVVATGETAQAAAAHAAAQRAAAERIERARALARARESKPTVRENQPHSMLLLEAREQVARARGAQTGSAPAAQPATGPQEANGGVTQESAGAGAGAGAPQRRASAPRSAREQAEAALARTSRNAAAATQAAASREQANRLRSMGVIGDTSEGMPDLDAALRRRRNVG